MSALRSKNARFSALKNPLFDVKLGRNFTFALHRLDVEMVGFRDFHLEGG